MALTPIITQACVALDKVLKDAGYEYRFYGGYEIIALGGERETKDLDVQVKLSFFKTEKKLRETLEAHPNFKIRMQSEENHSILGLYFPDPKQDECVGVDIILERSSFVDLPHGKNIMKIEGNEIPFYPITHIFRVKLACIATRAKPNDFRDLEFLWNGFREQIESDVNKIKKGKFKITETTQVGESGIKSQRVELNIHQVLEKAITNAPADIHPATAEILQTLGQFVDATDE